MKGTFGGRLKTQLMIAFMVIITVMMIFVGTFTYRKVEVVLEKQSADITQQYFIQNEYNIQSFADEINKLMTSLTQMDEIETYVQTGWREEFDVIMNANDIFEETTKIMGNYDYIDSIYVYGDNGVIIGNNGKENIVVRTRDKSQPFYQNVIYEKAIKNPWEVLWFGGFDSDDFEGSETMRRQAPMPYITAVGSVNVIGRHMATVVLNIEENVLADMIGYADEGHRRESFLVDENGIVVVHRDAGRLGAKVEFPEGMTAEQDDYYMMDDVQVNYRKLKGQKNLPWTLISEVPVSVLYEDMNSLRQWFVAAVVIALAVACMLSMYWMYRLTKPLDELRRAMLKMEQGDLGGQLEENYRNELGMLGRQFNKMSQSIQELVCQIQEVEKEKRILEKEALQAQINPHFLFNTLTNIKYMAMMAKADTVVESITALGNFLAPIYKSTGDSWTVKEEISYIENYVKIMNYRYGGKIRMNCEYGENTECICILKFILQPVVENAIQHGFGAREGMGNIRIRFGELDEQLLISVEDDGCGLSGRELVALNERLESAQKHDGHIGLANVHRRLKVYYGEDYGVRVESRLNVGTTVKILLPLGDKT